MNFLFRVIYAMVNMLTVTKISVKSGHILWFFFHADVKMYKKSMKLYKFKNFSFRNLLSLTIEYRKHGCLGWSKTSQVLCCKENRVKFLSTCVFCQCIFIFELQNFGLENHCMVLKHTPAILLKMCIICSSLMYQIDFFPHQTCMFPKQILICQLFLKPFETIATNSLGERGIHYNLQGVLRLGLAHATGVHG